MIQVEVWSDVVCPWCYIGKRRLEGALATFPGEVSVEWRSFQLDPSTPTGDPRTVGESLAARRGFTAAQVKGMFANVTAIAAQEGLDFDFDRARTANTLDAHRLLHFAKAHGRQGELKERLMRGYFTEGADVADHTVLAGLAAEVGLDEVAAKQALTDGSYAEDVDADIAQARAYGISGVPFFVFNQRIGVSGAQPLEVFEQALAQSSLTVLRAPEGTASAAAGECTDDSCAI
ncbi:DsbA family oxidoreductase [Dactylosporangium matsuzakiense]|uniref:DSBA oxidoreductase n=1 Tax=Dactylosporangium matsuzakiense TaxID=53360 RepID=A0A9W6NKU0_9ACTN|nr:DsbA family oxidoreductase [Dactylosporangium matsuzakiense]GLL00192.1 DSBA oxidoreductase [Dactylosporangium matsuzakiense]